MRIEHATDLPVSALCTHRVEKRLARGGISTIGDLTGSTEAYLLEVTGIGRRGLKEIGDALSIINDSAPAGCRRYRRIFLPDVSADEARRRLWLAWIRQNDREASMMSTRLAGHSWDDVARKHFGQGYGAFSRPAENARQKAMKTDQAARRILGRGVEWRDLCG